MPADTVLPERPEEQGDERPPEVLAVGPLQTVAPRSFILMGLFLLVLFHTLLLTRDLFLPLMLAFFLSFLLSPVLRVLKRAHIPEAVGAALLLLVLVGGVGLGVYSLVTPATEWIAKAPESMTRVQRKLRALRAPIQQMNRTADAVERTIAGDTTAAPVAAVKSPSWIKEAVFGGTTAFVSEAIVVIVLLYFLLASGDLFLRKLIKVLPTFKDKKRAVEIAREMERNISTYLFTVTLINIGVGVAVGVGVWLLKMPNPVLWGVLAGVLTYIPYLGAMVGIGILGLAALLVFDDRGAGPRGARGLPGGELRGRQLRHPHGPGPSPHPEPGGHLRGPALLVLPLGHPGRAPGRAHPGRLQDRLRPRGHPGPHRRVLRPRRRRLAFPIPTGVRPATSCRVSA